MLMKKILIIEDDVRIAQNIRRVLTAEHFHAEIAHNGNEGKNQAIENDYDLILLDINLPGMNGLEVCRQIRRFKATLPIIMLTAYGEIEDKVDGFTIGANDYIVKPFDFRELLVRINAAIRFSELGNPDSRFRILKIADLEMNLDSKIVTRSGKFINLTAKEFTLLEYMLVNRELVISKSELARNVWQLQFDSGSNLIEVYINYLRKKVDRDFAVKLIHTRPGMGYVLKEKLV
jgi:two-component system copper resistance phosphate regulon response regulator CusR